MTRSHTVSVAIPTYNRPKYLLESLQSVLAQVPPPDQIVVVDDGSSTPQDPALLELAAKGVIRLIVQKNRGTAAACNRAAEELTSDLVFFFGDDDVLLPGALAGLREALEENPDAVGAAGGARIWKMNDGSLSDVHWPDPDRGTFDGMMKGNPLFAGAVMIRRDAFEKVGRYEQKLPIVEDWDLWVKLSRIGKFVFPRVEVMHYRQHGANVMASTRGPRLTISFVERLLAGFTPAERARYGPTLASNVSGNYTFQILWHIQCSVKQAKFRGLAGDLWLFWRLFRLGLKYPDGRKALRKEWENY